MKNLIITAALIFATTFTFAEEKKHTKAKNALGMVTMIAAVPVAVVATPVAIVMIGVGVTLAVK